jgi:hypothetical protein
LREVVCLVLKLREEKQTFRKVGGGKIDFFLLFLFLPCRGRPGPFVLEHAGHEQGKYSMGIGCPT